MRGGSPAPGGEVARPMVRGSEGDIVNCPHRVGGIGRHRQITHLARNAFTVHNVPLGVQFIEIPNAGHRRGEPALHGLDGCLGVGLLVAPSRHAEEGIEDVVAGQRGVAGMEPAFASLKDERGNGPGVVPPDLLGDAAEELEGRDHAFEDRLGALEGEGQNEGSVRVGPGGDQERNQPPAIGEIDVDVAEIGLEALAWEVSQRDERLAMAASVLVHIALHLAVTPVVAVFVLQATKHLHGGVALLGGRVLVVARIWSMIDWKGPRTGAVRFLSRGMGLGCGCFKIFRIVFRECLTLPDCRFGVSEAHQ